MLELLQHQFTLTLERLWFYLAAFWIKRRQPGQIDEAVGNGDGVRHPAFAIALQISRNRLNPHAFDHGRSSRVCPSLSTRCAQDGSATTELRSALQTVGGRNGPAANLFWAASALIDSHASNQDFAAPHFGCSWHEAADSRCPLFSPYRVQAFCVRFS